VVVLVLVLVLVVLVVLVLVLMVLVLGLVVLVLVLVLVPRGLLGHGRIHWPFAQQSASIGTHLRVRRRRRQCPQRRRVTPGTCW
jgi:hypothetical protein